MTDNMALAGEDHSKDLYGENMTKADVDAIAEEYAQNLKELSASLDKISEGHHFSEASEKMKSLINNLNSGKINEFLKKNTSLSKAEGLQNFLNYGIKTGEGELKGNVWKDRMAVADFYDVLVRTAEFRKRFVDILEECSYGRLLCAIYRAIRFESDLTEMVKQEDLTDINEAYREFGNLYGSSFSSDIYNRAKTSTHNTFLENEDILLTYLEQELFKQPHLSKFLMNISRVTPEKMNRLYAIDSKTANFTDIASNEDKLKALDESCYEERKLYELDYPSIPEEFGTFVFEFCDVLNKLIELTQRAVQILINFKEVKDKAPYAIMHYDSAVTSVISRFGLKALSAPLEHGTSYHKGAQDMVYELRELAELHARDIPY